MPEADSSLHARVLAVLRSGGLLTAAQIGEELGVDRLPVRRALVRLQQRGLVRLAGMDLGANTKALGGAPGIWELAPASHADR